MADLSPAAQEILAAYENSPFEYDTGHLTACAAVLRAAADGCDPNWLATTVFHHLHAIADELEGVKYGTYRCSLEAQ
jgi:hypothetical protein